MKLGVLVRVVPGAKVVGSPDVNVRRVVHDSRQVRRGDLFAALPGTKVDGHAFVRAALLKGAAAALVERRLRLPRGTPLLLVPDAHVAFGLAAHALAGRPTERLVTCGVTGSCGKTTTTYLLRSIFEAHGWPTGLIGTIESIVGDRRTASTMTTPDAAVLASGFAEMVRAGQKAAVMEVSSHSLHQKRTAGIRFRVGAFTNLSAEHLDYHKNMKDYREAKQILFEALTPDATAVLNADDKASRFLAKATGARVLWCGIDKPADVRAEDLRLDTSSSRFVLVTPRGRVEVRTPLVGEYNVRNCLTAAAAAEALEIPLETIARGIAAMPSVRGRLEVVPSDRPFRVLVDYAHKTEALVSVLTTVGKLLKGNGRLVVVFGCGGDRDRQKRPKMAKAAEKLADRVIVTSDNPRSEKPQAIVDEILKGFSSKAVPTVVLDRRAAIELAIDEARPGDVIVIAGKGHETYQIVGSETRPFDDFAVASEILAGAALRGGSPCSDLRGGSPDPPRRCASKRRSRVLDAVGQETHRAQ
jgi:UDP-N-acetylmuramoyl-L-alanyl-D-glutamate--2,6-diaminopimelate ligase